MKKELNFQIPPENINAVYADIFGITRTPFGFTLDFGQQIPQLSLVNIFSRIACSPQHTKQLSELINNSIAEYEKEFGEIKITAQMKEELSNQRLGFKP